MIAENLAMQYLTGQLVVSYRTINRFRVAAGMENLLRELFIELNLQLKMEKLVTLDGLYIDGTKIEAKANKYSFVWKKATEKFSAKLQEQMQVYFQEEITPLIHPAIELDTQEPISSEQLTEFAQLLEEELAGLSQDIEETPVKGPDLAPQKGLYQERLISPKWGVTQTAQSNASASCLNVSLTGCSSTSSSCGSVLVKVQEKPLPSTQATFQSRERRLLISASSGRDALLQ